MYESIIKKCKVICTTMHSPGLKLPVRFELNSEWCFEENNGMFCIDGFYFTNNEFNHHFTIINKFKNSNR